MYRRGSSAEDRLVRVLFGCVVAIGLGCLLGLGMTVFNPVSASAESAIEVDQQRDCTLLPNWERDIPTNYWKQDDEGSWTSGTIDITDVSVVSQEPESSGKTVVSISNYGDDWFFEAKNYGTATVSVSYVLEGTPSDYSFTVHVARTAYNLMIDTDTGDTALPGGSVKLLVHGKKEFIDDEERYQSTTEGLSYAWSIIGDGNEYATITGEGDTATVRFREKRDDESDYWHEVEVEAAVLDDAGNPCEHETYWVFVAEDYCCVTPATIDRDLEIGQSKTVTLALMQYALDKPEGVDISDGATFWIEDSHGYAVDASISGNTCTVTRTGTENGGFSVIGEVENGPRARVDYQFFEKNYDMWFAGENGDNFDLFVNKDGQGKQEKLPLEASWLDTVLWDEHWSLTYEAGDWDRQGEWHPVDGFIVSSDKTGVVVDPSSLYAQNIDGVDVVATVSWNGAVVSNAYAWVNVNEEESDYGLRDDWDALPRWSITIDKQGNAFVRNAAHPDGLRESYEVIDVTISSQKPQSGSGDVVSITERKYEDGQTILWDIETLQTGTATITERYKDLDGNEQTHSFNINVGTEVFGLDAWTTSADRALPGESIQLEAEGWRMVDGGGRSQDGLDYEWSLDETGRQLAQLVVDPADHAHATLTFNAPQEGELWRDKTVFVTVSLVYDGSVRATRDIWSRMSSEYTDLTPYELDGLSTFAPLTVTPELRYYSLETGTEGVTLSNPTFTWNYDPALLEVVDNGDGTFTFNRLSTDSFEIELEAVAEDADGNEYEEWREYWIDDEFFDIWYNPFEYVIKNGSSLTIDLGGNIPAEAEGLIHYTVGQCYYDDATDRFVFTEALRDDEFSCDGRHVTISADVINRHGWSNGAMVQAVLDLDDDYDPYAICRVMTADNPGSWKRLSGEGRYDTMAEIVKEGFESSEWAVVAYGQNYPDALAAASLAGYRNCPVILTARDSLSPQAKSELKRLGVKNAYVMGGTAAVSDATVNEMKNSLGIKVTRIAGNDRQETSVAALRELYANNPEVVVIATGTNYADTLSIGPWCYRGANPLLLTGWDKKLTKAQVDAIKQCKTITNVIIVGGPNAVSPEVEQQLSGYYIQRLAGKDRYRTSAAIAEWSSHGGMGVAHVAVATGKNYPDALAGSALCGRNSSALLLADDPVGGDDYPRFALTATLDGHGSQVACGYAFGGEGAVSPGTLAYCQKLTKTE